MSIQEATTKEPAVQLPLADRDNWQTLPYRVVGPQGGVTAAFAFERDYEHYLNLVLPLNDPKVVLSALVREFCRSQEYADLGGVTEEDCDGPLPLAALRAALVEALAETDMLLKHECDWNAQGFCRICNRDGNA